MLLIRRLVRNNFGYYRCEEDYIYGFSLASRNIESYLPLLPLSAASMAAALFRIFLMPVVSWTGSIKCGIERLS